jgi:putative flippase GtrA
MTLDVRRRLLAGARPHRPAAEREGLRIHEVPVDWVDDPDSRAAIVSTATDDLRGVWRLLRSPWRVDVPGLIQRRGPAAGLGGQVRSFAMIGVLSTLAYAGLYEVLRSFASPVEANAIALLATAIGNTAANRRLTFGIRERASLLHDHAAGLTAFALALGITTGAVSLLELLAPRADRASELAVLLAANVLATVARFALLRAWILPARPAMAWATTPETTQGTAS